MLFKILFSRINAKLDFIEQSLVAAHNKIFKEKNYAQDRMLAIETDLKDFKEDIRDAIRGLHDRIEQGLTQEKIETVEDTDMIKTVVLNMEAKVWKKLNELESRFEENQNEKH